jgi:hypothetical protein
MMTLHCPLRRSCFLALESSSDLSVELDRFLVANRLAGVLDALVRAGKAGREEEEEEVGASLAEMTATGRSWTLTLSPGEEVEVVVTTSLGVLGFKGRSCCRSRELTWHRWKASTPKA